MTAEKIRQRCGTVALVGWTNVGKSTLFNRLVGDKLSAVADAAQTTRHRITGVRNVAGGGQLVLVDTPGLHRPKYLMNRGMVEGIRKTIVDVDLTLVVVDASRGLGPGDREVLRLLGSEVRPVVALNKIDQLRPKARLLPLMQVLQQEAVVSEVFPISARTGEGCETLLEELVRAMPEGPPRFEAEYWTDQTERALAAEWIREKLLHLTRQELPHATAVHIERWHERADGLVEIEAGIFVDRESQKQIVIGRGGELLKEVGTSSRIEIERLLERRVFLRLWVRVRKDWRNDQTVLRQLGLESS